MIENGRTSFTLITEDSNQDVLTDFYSYYSKSWLGAALLGLKCGTHIFNVSKDEKIIQGLNHPRLLLEHTHYPRLLRSIGGAEKLTLSIFLRAICEFHKVC